MCDITNTNTCSGLFRVCEQKIEIKFGLLSHLTSAVISITQNALSLNANAPRIIEYNKRGSVTSNIFHLKNWCYHKISYKWSAAAAYLSQWAKVEFLAPAPTSPGSNLFCIISCVFGRRRDWLLSSAAYAIFHFVCSLTLDRALRVCAVIKF